MAADPWVAWFFFGLIAVLGQLLVPLLLVPVLLVLGLIGAFIRRRDDD